MKNLADSLSAPPVSGAAAQTKASTTKPLRLGLLTALVIGSMIGSGVFSLPQNMASGAGAAAVLIGWLITGVGMLMLAFVYQTLTTRKPDLDNGSYAYARASAGEFVGFNSAWRCHVPVDERWSQRGHRQRARASGPALQDETQGGRRSSHWPRRMARRCEDQDGSWWPIWSEWLKAHSSTQRVAPPPMSLDASGHALADAPGSYVFQV